MRPVDKPKVGTEVNGTIVQANYSIPSHARPVLEGALGAYCCYCEVFDSTVQVDHIIPQNQDKAKVNLYDNFLLSCGNCNGGHGKKGANIHLDSYFWPHLHNTAFIFCITTGGMVRVNQSLEARYQTIAAETLNLLGLNRYPGSPNNLSPNKPSHETLGLNDKRWEYRQTVWDIAELFKSENYSIDLVCSTALLRGYLSI